MAPTASTRVFLGRPLARASQLDVEGIDSVVQVVSCDPRSRGRGVVTERGVVTVLMTGINEKDGVGHRVDSRCLGVGLDIIDIGGEAVGEAVEENIDTEGIEVKLERLELTVLSLDLVHPVSNRVLSVHSILNEAAAQGKHVLSV
jgi:hypothetical protein